MSSKMTVQFEFVEVLFGTIVVSALKCHFLLVDSQHVHLETIIYCILLHADFACEFVLLSLKVFVAKHFLSCFIPKHISLSYWIKINFSLSDK